MERDFSLDAMPLASDFGQDKLNHPRLPDAASFKFRRNRKLLLKLLQPITEFRNHITV
jgi:hypothetical protein